MIPAVYLLILIVLLRVCCTRENWEPCLLGQAKTHLYQPQSSSRPIRAKSSIKAKYLTILSIPKNAICLMMLINIFIIPADKRLKSETEA
jgi:hypothetical protein